jgi:hypothetical protein
MTEPEKPRYGYICLYGAQRWEVYADSLYDAKQKALEHFKPPKSRRYQVTAHLAEIDGETVIQPAP